jgi:UDP-N-acetylglucosamine 4,6-dehydratase
VLNDKSILITGGTGSFGKAAVKYILDNYKPKRLIIFSRDELKQFEMARIFPDSTPDSPVRYFVGDIRDRDRMRKAFQGVDYVIHAAALKQVPSCEYNPAEAVKTNILGTQNIIDVATSGRIQKVIFISTDKAVEPCNLYGMTKAVAEKLVVNANLSGNHTMFSVVRYGNVMGSRGSVIPYFKHLASTGNDIPITHPDMTRFWITLEEAVRFVIDRLGDMIGGEIFVPRIPSMSVVDLAEAIAPKSNLTMIGIRPGEKIYEKLISSNERRVSPQTTHFIIYPEYFIFTNDEKQKKWSSESFEYRSDNNARMLSVEELQKAVQNIMEE